MHAMELGYHGETLTRWRKTMRSAPFASLLKVPLVYTNSGHFLSVLHYPGAGTSTNKWLRIVHNRALDLGWLLSPVMARKRGANRTASNVLPHSSALDYGAATLMIKTTKLLA